jgi:hypothetical protein
MNCGFQGFHGQIKSPASLTWMAHMFKKLHKVIIDLIYNSLPTTTTIHPVIVQEKDEYVENIITDIQSLGLKPEKITYTSDYFPQLQVPIYQLLKCEIIKLIGQATETNRVCVCVCVCVCV